MSPTSKPAALIDLRPTATGLCLKSPVQCWKVNELLGFAMRTAEYVHLDLTMENITMVQIYNISRNFSFIVCFGIYLFKDSKRKDCHTLKRETENLSNGLKKKIHLSPKPQKNKLAVLTSPLTAQVVSVYFHLDVKLKTTEQIQLLCTSLEEVQNYSLFHKGQGKVQCCNTCRFSGRMYWHYTSQSIILLLPI